MGSRLPETGLRLRFQYAVEKSRQLVISDSEIDACRRDDDSDTHERPPESAVPTTEKVREA
ncbi:MAG TPA: hypothetical protein VGF97_02095, partial [Rhizomicrobium sp.]